MAFRPSHNLVAFVPVEVKKESKGQIQIVDGTKYARVIAVGPGKHLPNGAVRPTCVKVGELILFSPMAGQTGHIRDVMVNGERVYYCDDQFIDGAFDETDVCERVPEEAEKKIIDPGEEDFQVMKIVTN